LDLEDSDTDSFSQKGIGSMGPDNEKAGAMTPGDIERHQQEFS